MGYSVARLKTFEASSAGNEPIWKPSLITGLKQDHTKVEAGQNDLDMGLRLPLALIISSSRGGSSSINLRDGLHFIAIVFFN